MATTERSFVCSNCGAAYNTLGDYYPHPACYECGERDTMEFSGYRTRFEGDA